MRQGDSNAMKCTHIQSKLIGFIDGDLHPADRDDVALHLRYCDACHQAYQALHLFNEAAAECIVYPDTPYPFAALRPRMAAVTPLNEVMAFFPKMRSRSLTGRLATAALLLVFALPLSWPARDAKENFITAKRTMAHASDKWEDEYQEQLDEEYRKEVLGHFNAPRG